MQNNVTYLSRKLQRSLDNNYNVIDMPAVIEIISTLEKTSITKELLETTRLGKSINELRRKTSNESLAKRAKELLKKWRDLLLPDANGQIRSSSANSVANSTIDRSDSPNITSTKSSKKRPASSTPPDNRISKKSLLNGQNREFEFSDNSNCSIKDIKKTDVIFINSDSNSSMPDTLQHGDHFDISTDNNDSNLGGNTSQPKKRGRKKGSKNHKNLVIAAEESFSNKMAISRNSKVKTTQELLADIQNRKPSSQQDIELRAAQLTESLSRIEHKLNPQKQINKNVTPIRNEPKHSSNNLSKSTSSHRISSGTISENWSSRSSPEVIALQSDDEIVDVVGTDPPSSVTSISTIKPESQTVQNSPLPVQESLTIENLLTQLPPIDKSCLEEPDEIPLCECPTPKVAEIVQPVEQEERITIQIEGLNPGSTKETSLFAPASPLAFFSEKTERLTPTSDYENDDRTCVSDSFETTDTRIKSESKSVLFNDNIIKSEIDETDENLENPLCPSKLFLRDKYHLDSVDNNTVDNLHLKFLPNVNGNFGVESNPTNTANTNVLENGLFNNIVPNFSSERLNKIPNENFQKYSISIDNNSDDNNSSDRTHISKSCDRQNAILNSGSSDTRTETDTEIGEGPTQVPVSTESTEHTDFREWHETLDVISYNDELLRILPYVIID